VRGSETCARGGRRRAQQASACLATMILCLGQGDPSLELELELFVAVELSSFVVLFTLVDRIRTELFDLGPQFFG
jgi:hypothetical protein